MMIKHKRKSNMRRIKELDDSISDEYSECYVCGRTNDNLKTLIKGNITEINARIKPYEDDLVDLTAEYNESIQEIGRWPFDRSVHEEKANNRRAPQ